MARDHGLGPPRAPRELHPRIDHGAPAQEGRAAPRRDAPRARGSRVAAAPGLLRSGLRALLPPRAGGAASVARVLARSAVLAREQAAQAEVELAVDQRPQRG